MLIAMKLSPYGVKPDLCFFLPSAACSWGPIRVLRVCCSFLWVCRKVKHKLLGCAIGLCALWFFACGAICWLFACGVGVWLVFFACAALRCMPVVLGFPLLDWFACLAIVCLFACSVGLSLIWTLWSLAFPCFLIGLLASPLCGAGTYFSLPAAKKSRQKKAAHPANS
ncbi:hypothetical protein [Paraburkholderia caffeinilytica]|uniref:hypothetical protein n=1 Tax=Paraburkholderia caffeinilytica TaxID=1761016 RepID=UPI003DA04046